MGDTKGRNKVIIALICLAALAIFGFIIYQHQQIRKLSQVNESLNKQVPEQKDIAQEGAAQDTTFEAKGKGQGEIDDLRYQLAAAEEELDLAHEQISELANKDTNNTLAGPMQDMMNRISDPEKKEELKKSLKRGFNQQYGTLFQLMNLSPEKLRQFKELLANQTMEMMKIANDVETVEPTEENRNNLQGRLDDFLKQREADLSALLGSQDYQTYKNYKDSQQERSIVQRFTFSLSAEDKLTNEQQEALINSMCQERKNVSSGTQLGGLGEKIFFPSDMAKTSDENMKNMKEMEERVKDAYLESTGNILTASQEEHFEEYFQQANAMMSLPMPIDPTAQENTEEGDGPVIVFRLYEPIIFLWTGPSFTPNI